MYWRRSAHVGVAAPGRITAQSVDEPELGHHQIDRHQDDGDRDHQGADHHQHGGVLALEVVDGKGIGRHGVDQKRDQGRDHRHEDRVGEKLREGEALQRLGVVFRRQRELAHGDPLVDGTLNCWLGLAGSIIWA